MLYLRPCGIPGGSIIVPRYMCPPLHLAVWGLMGPSQGCKLHRRLYVPPPAPQGLWFERSGAFGRPRTPPRWCFAGHFSHAMLPISSVSRVRERRRRPHDPRPWAGEIARGQHHVCQRGSRSPSSSEPQCASSRYRRLPLSVPLAMMLPWAAPARPIALRCPAISRNGVTEAQLHRAVAKRRRRVQ